MSRYLVFVDACSFIPHAATDLLFRLSEVGILQIYCSELVLDEVERNLVKKLGLTPEQATRRVKAMRSSLGEGLVSGFEATISSMTNHSGDRHVLAGAVASPANWIVTENIKHFQPDALAPHGKEAIKVSDLFWILYLDQPETVTQVMAARASSLNISITQLLEKFRDLSILRTFAEKVEKTEQWVAALKQRE